MVDRFASSRSRGLARLRSRVGPAAVISLALVLAACTSDDDESGAPGEGGAPPASEPSGSDAPSDPPGEGIPAELGRWTDQQGFERVYIEVDGGISDSGLVDLATGLHEDHPDIAKFYFMDDGSQISQVLAALPETEQGNTENWPLDWVTEHTVAVLELAIYPDEPQQRWILSRGLSADVENPLVELE